MTQLEILEMILRRTEAELPPIALGKSDVVLKELIRQLHSYNEHSAALKAQQGE